MTISVTVTKTTTASSLPINLNEGLPEELSGLADAIRATFNIPDAVLGEDFLRTTLRFLGNRLMKITDVVEYLPPGVRRQVHVSPKHIAANATLHTDNQWPTVVVREYESESAKIFDQAEILGPSSMVFNDTSKLAKERNTRVTAITIAGILVCHEAGAYLSYYDPC